DPQRQATAPHPLIAEPAEHAVTPGGEARQVDVDHVGVAGVEAAVVVALDVAVAVTRHSGDQRLYRVGDERAVDNGVVVDAVEGAGRHFGVAALAFGLARVDLDRTAERVHPRERALRAAQHLDALDVGQVERAAEHGAVVDVVDVGADAGLDRRALVGLADAADEHAHRVALAGRVPLQQQAWHLRGDVGQRGLAALL